MTKIIRTFALVVVFGSLFAAAATAQTVNAASCNTSDVQTALNSVNQASATVNIPAGSCTWKSDISYTIPAGTTSLVIQGAGAEYANTGGASISGSDVTIITDNINHGSNNQADINFVVAAGQSLRVTAIAFLQNGSSSTNTNGMLSVSGASTAVRVDHCHFYLNVGEMGMTVGGSVTGVADHDYFQAASGALTFDIEFTNGENWGGDTVGYGDVSWTDTDHWGTSEFFFVEDTQFYGDIGDSENGGRYVLRYDTITGDGSVAQMMFNHALTDSRGRGFRAAEVYDNTFTQSGNQSNSTFALNGGTLLYWGNTVTGGYQNTFLIDYTRKNNITYNYGSPASDWGNCGTSSGTGWDGNMASGGYPCMNEPARGAGDLIVGEFPTVCDQTTGCKTYMGSWVHQALSPIYAWENTYSPKYYSSSPMVGNNTTIITDNRDYYQQFGPLAESGSFSGTSGINESSSTPTGNCTAGTDPATGGAAPGVGWWDTSNNTLYVCTATNTWTVYYTPYTYPHPLTQGTVNPPTNLSATVY